MTKEDSALLDHVTLDAHEWRGIRELANALSDLEPLAKRGQLGQIVADRLVRLGLAERGPAVEHYASKGYRIGYRLTDLGWKVMERGRFARSR